MEKTNIFWMMAATALLAAGIAQAVECPEQIPDLVSYWKFDEDAGTTAYDTVNSNDGIVIGAERTTGQIDGALEFDGVDDYVPLSTNAVTTTEFTITAWANHYGPGGGLNNSNIIFSQRDDLSSSTITLFTEATSGSPYARITVRSSSGPKQNVVYPKKDYNQWHHYCATVDSDYIILYIDGIEVDREENHQTGNYTTSIDSVDIGRHRYGGANTGFFNGAIDDVASFSRALTEDEIMQIYLDGVEGFGLALDHRMIAVNGVKNAIDVKREAIETANAAIRKERGSLAALEELQDCDDPGLRPQAIRQAIQRIEQAIGRQENIRKELRKSIRSLNIVLWQLGCIQGNCD